MAANTALASGSQAGTGSAVALNSGTRYACREVVVQNDHDSAGGLLVGTSAGAAFRLAPGESIVIPIDNVNKVYVQLHSASAATARWLAGR